MLPVEVAQHYQEIIQHLLDEIRGLQVDKMRLYGEVKQLQDRVPPAAADNSETP